MIDLCHETLCSVINLHMVSYGIITYIIKVYNVYMNKYMSDF